MTAPDRRTEWLIEAVMHDDTHAAETILRGFKVAELRDLCLALATRARPVTEDAVDTILAAAVQPFGVTAADVLCGDRHREASEARAVACYAAHLLGLSAKGTGRRLGLDHSSVIYNRSRVGENPRLRRIAQTIAAQLGWNREAVA